MRLFWPRSGPRQSVNARSADVYLTEHTVSLAIAPAPAQDGVEHFARHHRRVAPAKPSNRRRLLAYAGLTPFAAYVLIFLAIPTILAVVTGFFSADGSLTFENITGLFTPTILATFGSSFWLSGVSAVIGAVVGALICYAMLGTAVGGVLRTTIESAASVLAQFGGVMLAFAFIATIGVQGLVTVILRDTFGFDIFADGVWLYQVPGLILPYVYFQVPLMVITFLPALTALRPQWAEANATLGGTRFGYWRYIAAPVLAPAFLGSLLLLFANAFSSFATAAALISQGSQIVPLQIRAALVSETVLGRENMAGALALGMIVVMVVVMWAYSVLHSRTARWQK
jgi:putative spermidine/putrescine transport system permease protein